VLSDSDKVDLRRYMGFPAFGNTLTPDAGYRYYQRYLIVEYRMNNLQPEEENRLTTIFLPNLRQLEQDIYGVRNNTDTAQAAVWHRNPLELSERVQNYNWWRTQLAQFFGVEPLNPPRVSVSMVV